jgi:predicted nuclease of restriction endonuclease-like (RecB) superfamily
MIKELDSEELAPVVRVLASDPTERQFSEILRIIRQSRTRAWIAANHALVEAYWNIGEFLSRRTTDAGWGKATVKQLADWLLGQEPGIRGFSASNLWRMKQFFEVYEKEPELAPLVRVLPWSANLLILAQCKTTEEREFYLRTASERRWAKRELDRQLDGGLFERMKLGQPALSPALAAKHPNASAVFKERYLLEFLQLPDGHAERDLQQALVNNLKQFLLELGRDFCFVGEQFCVQVGAEDFFVDLLFYTTAVYRHWSRLNSRLGASGQPISDSCSSIWKRSTATTRSPTRIRRLASYFAKATTRTWLSMHWQEPSLRPLLLNMKPSYPTRLYFVRS